MSGAPANLGEIMDRGEQSNAPALIDLSRATPRTWTTRELVEASDAIARGLNAQNLPQGASIALLAGNCAEMLIAYFAIMRAGLVAVPINHNLPAATITEILKDCDAQGAFVDEARTDLAANLPLRWRIDTPSMSGLRNDGPFTPPALAPSAIAQILYTSGSTGRPKGVPLTHDGQVWSLEKLRQNFAPFAERMIVAAPLYHMNGLLFSSMALANKVTAVLMGRFSARDYLEAVATYRCTIASGIPTMFAMMAREQDTLARLDLSSVKRAMMGSSPLTDSLIADARAMFPNAIVWNGYGTTESGPCNFGPHPGGLARPELSIGYPYPDVELKLVGPGAPTQGVLHVRGRATMDGYLNLPGESAKRLDDGWFNTGDVLRRDENGFHYFVGRADDMFVCGGENVYPGEVEKLLEAHPAIAEAIVVAAPDPIKGQIPIAFVVLREGAHMSEDEIKTYTLREGPAYRHPRRVLIKESLPLSGPGKIDRKTLSAEAIEATQARR